MDFTKFATAISATTTSTKPGNRLVEFVKHLAENHVRITYAAIDTARRGYAPKGMPYYKDVLNALPPELQWAICNSEGRYHSNAIVAWAKVAPEGFLHFPYIRPETAVEAFAEWCKEQDGETAQAAE